MPKPVEVLIREAADKLRAANIENPRREARLLLEWASSRSRVSLLMDPSELLSSETIARYNDALASRSRHMPFAYITGRQEFYGRTFAVGPGVLIPRPETELLVECGLKAIEPGQSEVRILDIGVGSGCVLLTFLAQLPDAFGVGVDLGTQALSFATANRDRLDLAKRCLLVQGNWLGAIGGPFDLVLSNPPYISSQEHVKLDSNVRNFEPSLALVGGVGGLSSYKVLADSVAPVMAQRSTLFLEIGVDQSDQIALIFKQAGWTKVSESKDLADHIRVLGFRPEHCLPRA